jgi:DNA-binding MarR family transcriptional regulator
MKLETAIQTNKFKNELHKASINVMYSAWWLKTLLAKELKEFGLTLEQYNVLRILKGKHPESLCVKDIAERMIEKNSNVPRIIDRLVIKKLVKRGTSSQDRRETTILLTGAGLSILESSTQEVNKTINSQLSLTDKEAEQLNLLVEKMRSVEQ